ncbi:MAG: ABC transporter ATP-binding protein [Sinobacteraceae bacterium]|nr:ABC transporter ATP-binding protein [Nevskiaceae bacterium]MCP5340499.1 ABC transporter ATP-binding protein [Nevskiaceae bacterium]MCP5360183.1 ABC transporter ATP-binding protein [Nevskiaceae bacterium]MCP5473196.1 ABC transporter ATP-binding protein [Nevskiaceae bacterium]
MSTAPAIVAQGLTRRFGSVVAVDHVDLTIPRTQIYGFLGPNGSGKSTAIRMLCGLLVPTSGQVDVLDHQMPRDAERMRAKLGYMTQKFSLWDDLTVIENLQFMARIFGFGSRERTARIAELTREYDLGSIATQRAVTLSGGQKQRLALAAATLHRPELLLLDEPTSAVDPQSRRDFWESLFRLVTQGTTILVSTHFMDEAERCHGLAILDRGHLVAEGAPQQLIRDIPAIVVEIEAADTVGARRALDGDPAVLSIAQLGTRLHALVDPATPTADARLRGLLEQAGVAAQVEIVRASLEDVFVAATGFRTAATSPPPQ